MKAKVLKYKFDGNTVVAPYMELEAFAENVYLSLSDKNEYGNAHKQGDAALAGIHWLPPGVSRNSRRISPDCSSVRVTSSPCGSVCVCCHSSCQRPLA